jgi:hypothetical protein
MKHWLYKNRKVFIGLLAGALTGYLYWSWAGCKSGSCAITSDPIVSSLYFSVMGGILFADFND